MIPSLSMGPDYSDDYDFDENGRTIVFRNIIELLQFEDGKDAIIKGLQYIRDDTAYYNKSINHAAYHFQFILRGHVRHVVVKRDNKLQNKPGDMEIIGLIKIELPSKIVKVGKLPVPDTPTNTNTLKPGEQFIHGIAP